MISNVCKIGKGANDLYEILKESERVAVYNDFNKKQTLQLRLICEELDGMLPNIIEDFNGKIWIEVVDCVCKVNVTIDIPELTSAKKEELIKIAKDKKNAAAVGIVGKIRNAVENLLLHTEDANVCIPSSELFYLSAGYCGSANFSGMWTLNQYKVNAKEKKQEDWDELEKSIIANLADDVVVGVKGRQASIVVTKNFR